MDQTDLLSEFEPDKQQEKLDEIKRGNRRLVRIVVALVLIRILLETIIGKEGRELPYNLGYAFGQILGLFIVSLILAIPLTLFPYAELPYSKKYPRFLLITFLLCLIPMVLVSLLKLA